MRKTVTPGDGNDVVAGSEVLPWLCLAEPGWMLNKDGSLLCGFEYQGIDVDNINANAVNEALKEIEGAINALDERFYLWWVVDKKRDQTYRRDIFQNEAAQVIDGEIADQFENNEIYALKFRFYLVYTGETGVFAYMENVRRLVNEENKSIVAAMFASMNPASMNNSAALHDNNQLQANIDTAEVALRKFESHMSQIQLTRLTDTDLENALIQCANPTLPTSTDLHFKSGALIDGIAALSDVSFGREVASVSGPNGSLLIANLTLTSYPIPSNARALEVILALNAEFRITHVVKCMSQKVSEKAVNDITKYYQLTQTTFLQKAIARVTGGEPTPKPGRVELYLGCVDAQARTVEENLGWSHHAMTITIMESRLPALEKRVDEVLRMLKAAFIRERIGLKASYLSLIPGVWDTQKRLNLVNVELLADSLPLLTIGEGHKQSNYLSEHYNKETPSMSVFRTKLGTSCNFNPHVGQNGHALLVMPSGGGKTTFVNYCLSQWQRYPDAQVVIFDRDWSCRIITGLSGGSHVDITDRPVQLNPMSAIKEGQEGLRWAREFLIRIIEEGGVKTTPDDRNDIDQKFRHLAESDAPVSLGMVAHLLPTHLHAALTEWIGDGPFGFFDSTQDDLEISNWTCIEMKQFMAIDRMARAFMDHAFRVLSKRLGTVPTFIYLEEASFLFKNGIFLAALDDWLKTFRKKTAFVWMSVQSPESISGIDDESIKATLTDNIPNIILGYNGRLENHRELYKNMFGISDEQVNMVGLLKPKQDYLLVTNEQSGSGNCRVLRTKFSKKMLAYLRSEGPFQNLFTQAQNSGRADWREWYVQQAFLRSSN